MSSDELFEYPLKIWVQCLLGQGRWLLGRGWRLMRTLLSTFFSLEHFSFCLVKGLKKLRLFVTFFLCLFQRACSVKAHLPDVDKESFVLHTIQRYFILSSLSFLNQLLNSSFSYQLSWNTRKVAIEILFITLKRKE